MCYWITDKGGTIQANTPNKVITETNQLFYHKGTLYLIPRNTVTDNYTIPLGINKSKWDARPSHLHDIGCRYHQVIVVELPLQILYSDYIDIVNNRCICRDIPKLQKEDSKIPIYAKIDKSNDLRIVVDNKQWDFAKKNNKIPTQE